MKLDKWPDTIECDGWKWKLDYVPNCMVFASPGELPDGCYYRRSEKLHVPPTMREIMEHLLSGGWVRHDWEKRSALFYRMVNQELEVSGNSRGDWSPCGDLCRGSFNRVEFFLTKQGDWAVGSEK